MLQSEKKKILMKNLALAKNKLKKMKNEQFLFLSKKIDEDFAYCLGTIKGDGNIYFPKSGGAHMRLAVKDNVKDKDFAEAFKERLDRWSGLKSRLFPDNGFWKVDLQSVSAIRVFNNYDISNFKNTSEKIKCSFIKGFSDAEGTIDRTARRIRIYNSDKNLIDTIMELLEEVGIENRVFKRESEIHKFPDGREQMVKPVYAIYISRSRNLKIFNEKIGFSIGRKQNVLRDSLDSLRIFPQKWNQKDIELLKLKFSRDIPAYELSRKIAPGMNREPDAVRRALYRFVIKSSK